MAPINLLSLVGTHTHTHTHTVTDIHTFTCVVQVASNLFFQSFLSFSISFPFLWHAFCSFVHILCFFVHPSSVISFIFFPLCFFSALHRASFPFLFLSTQPCPIVNQWESICTIPLSVWICSKFIIRHLDSVGFALVWCKAFKPDFCLIFVKYEIFTAKMLLSRFHDLQNSDSRTDASCLALTGFFLWFFSSVSFFMLLLLVHFLPLLFLFFVVIECPFFSYICQKSWICVSIPIVPSSLTACLWSCDSIFSSNFSTELIRTSVAPALQPWSVFSSLLWHFADFPFFIYLFF